MRSAMLAMPALVLLGLFRGAGAISLLPERPGRAERKNERAARRAERRAEKEKRHEGQRVAQRHGGDEEPVAPAAPELGEVPVKKLAEVSATPPAVEPTAPPPPAAAKPRPLPPVPPYFCPTAEELVIAEQNATADTSANATGSSIFATNEGATVLAEWLSPTGHHSEEVMAMCQPERRAAAAISLEKKFHRTFARFLTHPFEKAEAAKYLTVGDWRTGPLLGNWLAHARNVTRVFNGTKIQVVNVALDKGGQDGCESFRSALPKGSLLELRCVPLLGWLPEEFFEADHALMGTCDYNMVLWTKPLILQAAVNASSYPVLLIDTDVILYQDLMQLGARLLEKGLGAKQVVSGRERNGRANTAAVYATKASLPFLDAWADQNSKCLNSREGDQSALQHLVYYEAGKKEALEVFPLSELGQCAVKGKAATHYNCVGRKHFVMEAKKDWDKSVSMKPEVIVPNRKVAKLSAGASDFVSAKIAAIREAGDWMNFLQDP